MDERELRLEAEHRLIASVFPSVLRSVDWFLIEHDARATRAGWSPHPFPVALCFGVLDQNDLKEYFDSPDQRADRESIYGVHRDALTDGGPSVITVNGVVASIAATELMVLVTRIRDPIPHQEWRGDQGYLCRVSNRKASCYYCGLRPAEQRGKELGVT